MGLWSEESVGAAWRFGYWSSFRECYVKDTGGRGLWDASRLVWVDEINIFVNLV